VEALFALLYADEGLRLTVDLDACSIALPDGALWSFSVDAFRRDCLLRGLDDIGLTLQSAEAIRQFEQRHEARFPWLFRDILL
jgi:3-isopropylmalate/(R)-2-methylmalate dehydratase small subunit